MIDVKTCLNTLLDEALERGLANAFEGERTVGARFVCRDSRKTGLLVVEVVSRRIRIEVGRAGRACRIVKEVARLATVKVERGANTLGTGGGLDVVTAVLGTSEVVSRG